MFAFDAFHRDRLRSINPEEREDFFQEKAEFLTWFKRWDRVLDCSQEPYVKWFCGGTLNLCYNALDRHVLSGLGDRVAIVCENGVSGQVTRYTYAQLLEQTQLVAGVLHNECGICKGDFVVIYMPKVVEAALAILACARLGAVACTVYGGMAAAELSRRIEHCQAKAVVSASGGLVGGRLFNFKAELELALKSCPHSPNHCLILLRDGMGGQDLCPERDLSWSKSMSRAQPFLDCQPMESNEPLYILYTSGTTGEPKGVLLPACYCLSYLYCTSRYLSPAIEGSRHVYMTSSEFGWILALYYNVVLPLLTGTSSLMFEGDFVKNFPRLVTEHNVTCVVSCNTPFREMRLQDPDCTFQKEFPCKSLSLLLLGGECADEELLRWTSKAFSCISADCYGQTELMHITGGIGSNLYDEDQRFLASWPAPGLDLKVLKENGQEAEPGTIGRICMKPPLRPGSILTIYKNDQYFEKEYFQTFPGYFDTKDSGMILENGRLRVCGRDDDVIIVDGSRVNGNELEKELRRMSTVKDCAVVPGPNPDHWEEPVAFVIFSNGQSAEGLAKSAKSRLLDLLSLPTLSVVPVSQLPMTRSGKVSRKTLKDLITKNELENVSLTIRNPESVQQIYQMIQRLREEKMMPGIIH